MHLHLLKTSVWVSGVRWVGNPSIKFTPDNSDRTFSIAHALWMEGIYLNGTSSFRYCLNSLKIDSINDWVVMRREIDLLLNHFRSYNYIEIDNLINLLFSLCELVGYKGMIIEPSVHHLVSVSESIKSSTRSDVLGFFNGLDVLRNNMIIQEVHE